MSVLTRFFSNSAKSELDSLSKIGSTEVDISNVAITTKDGTWYYGSKAVTGLPTDAKIIGVSIGPRYDADIIPLVFENQSISLRSPVSKTVISGRTLTVYYAYK